MSVYVIADLHLSTNADKSMEVFGKRWQNYIEKLKTLNPVTIPAMSYGKLGTPSISIVFNVNGKRLTISKALANISPTAERTR